MAFSKPFSMLPFPKPWFTHMFWFRFKPRFEQNRCFCVKTVFSANNCSTRKRRYTQTLCFTHKNQCSCCGCARVVCGLQDSSFHVAGGTRRRRLNNRPLGCFIGGVPIAYVTTESSDQWVFSVLHSHQHGTGKLVYMSWLQLEKTNHRWLCIKISHSACPKFKKRRIFRVRVDENIHSWSNST